MSTNAKISDPARFSILGPRALWIGFPAVVLFLSTIAVALADDQRGRPTPQSTQKESTVAHPFCTNGKWGYIDNHGKTVIEPQLDYAGRFSEGLAPARKGEIAGYLDISNSFR